MIQGGLSCSFSRQFGSVWEERCAKKIDVSHGQRTSMHLIKGCSCFHESCMMQWGNSGGLGGALDPKCSNCFWEVEKGATTTTTTTTTTTATAQQPIPSEVKLLHFVTMAMYYLSWAPRF